MRRAEEVAKRISGSVETKDVVLGDIRSGTDDGLVHVRLRLFHVEGPDGGRVRERAALQELGHEDVLRGEPLQGRGHRDVREAVRVEQPRVRWDILDAFAAAAVEAGRCFLISPMVRPRARD